MNKEEIAAAIKDAERKGYSDGWEAAVAALRQHCPEAPLLRSPREKIEFENKWDALVEEKSR